MINICGLILFYLYAIFIYKKIGFMCLVFYVFYTVLEVYLFIFIYLILKLFCSNNKGLLMSTNNQLNICQNKSRKREKTR